MKHNGQEIEPRARSIRMRVSEAEKTEIHAGIQAIIQNEGIAPETYNREPGIRDGLLWLLRDYQSRNQVL